MGRITDAVQADHRDLESYYERILHAEGEDEQTRLQNQFTWELARHVVGEDLVVFPALERYLRDGDATEDREKHHIVSVFWASTVKPAMYIAMTDRDRSNESCRSFKT